jgi:hypothetical protein
MFERTTTKVHELLMYPTDTWSAVQVSASSNEAMQFQSTNTNPKPLGSVTASAVPEMADPFLEQNGNRLSYAALISERIQGG